MGIGIILIQTFVVKVINNERKILTHHENIDGIAEQIVSCANNSLQPTAAKSAI